MRTVTAVTTGRKRARIIPAVTMMTRGRLPVNMTIKRLYGASFLACRRLASLARFSICQVISELFSQNARTRSNVRISQNHRAGVGRPGPIFRPVTPICKFFATSSDLYMALNSPESQPSRRADRESSIWRPFLVKANPRPGAGRKKYVFLIL